MDRWGSSYLLHDVEAGKLVASVGSSTGHTGRGEVKICFAEEHNVCAVEQTGAYLRLALKWDVALRLIALLQVLLSQNALLRDEAPESGRASGAASYFKVVGGFRTSPLVCECSALIAGVSYTPAESGKGVQGELVLSEAAAGDLVAALVQRIALNGTTKAREQPPQ